MRPALPFLLTLTLCIQLPHLLRADDDILSVKTEPIPAPKMTTILFPVLYKVQWSDTFGAPRDGGKRKHQGQDLSAPKMTPLVAVFDGVIYRGPGGPGGHYTLSVTNDEGWTANYYHVNNDTPGTDDGDGGEYYAFAAGFRSGDRVKAGQLIGYVGDSGNAENTGPHCHFELWYQGQCVNAALSLRKARHITDLVVNLPATDLKPESGEVRFDGSVHSVEGDLLVLDLASETRPGKQPTANRKPARRYVLLKEAKLHCRQDSALALTASDIQPGMPVTVIGKEQGKGKALLARLTAPALPEGAPALMVASRSNVTISDTQQPERVDTPPPARETNTLIEPKPEGALKTPKPHPAATPDPIDDIALEAARQINEIRKQRGLTEFSINGKLSRAALRHSKDMAEGGFCEHNGSEGSRPWDRVEEVGYKPTRVAQNIAAGFDAPEKVINAWMTRSRDSERNLLDKTFTEIGIARYRAANGSRYWTLVLATP